MTKSLLSDISKDFTAALKAKDKEALGTLRMLKAALTMREKDLRRELTDEDAMEVLLKEAKQRNDSIAEFTKAGRSDLADKEKAELVILERYLPTPLSQEELEQAVDRCIADTGASSMKDMSSVMQAIMQEYKGRVDGKAVSAMVRARLAS